MNIFSQIELDIYFYDECDNKIKKIDFHLLDSNFEEIGYDEFYNLVNYDVTKPTVDSLGIYHLNATLEIDNGNLGALVLGEIDIKSYKKYTDTINIPRIRFVTPTYIHATEWDYYNCSKLCDGYEIDFYGNGEIRLEGYFNNGKPYEITEYREDGTLDSKEFFDVGNLRRKRIEYYDANGELYEYEVSEFIKNVKLTTYTYDSYGSLIEENVQKYNHKKN